MTNPLRTPTLFISLFVLSGAALPGRLDGNTGPAGVVPSPSVVSPGAAFTLKITLNAAPTSPTVVYLSSNSSYFAVPNSVTFPTGSTVAYASGLASPDAPPTGANITAAANGYYAACAIESSTD